MARANASVSLSAAALDRIVSGSDGAHLLQDIGYGIARDARLFSEHNGTIAQGIIVLPVSNKSVKVVSTNPHTLLVHNGSRPHDIRPRRSNGYLRFEIDGRIVFAKKVSHPGYRGNPFMTDALNAAHF